MQLDEQRVLRLFNSVSSTVGSGVTNEKMARMERSLSYLVYNTPPPKPFITTSSVLTSAVIGLTVLVTALLLFMHDKPLLFSVGDSRTAGTEGVWMKTDKRESTALRFDQGSNIWVRPNSALQIKESNEDTVAFGLKKGTIDAEIVGNGRTRWLLQAGPYIVSVLGTAFSVAWDKQVQQLDVKVKNGNVLVQGKGIAGRGIQVSGGNHLRVVPEAGLLAMKTVNSKFYDPNERMLVATHIEPDERDVYGDALSSGNALLSHDRKRYVPGEHTAKKDSRLKKRSLLQSDKMKIETTRLGSQKSNGMPAQRRSSLSRSAWKTYQRERSDDLEISGRVNEVSSNSVGNKNIITSSFRNWISEYNKGAYGLAVNEARSAGIERLLERLNVDELWKLVHAARTSGNKDIAKDALIACRERFPGSKKAKIAAFLIAKIYVDQEKEHILAIDWFRTYLSEDASGPLAEEALGRLMLVYSQLGRGKDAADAAHVYLKSYTGGAFCDSARAIIGIKVNH